MPLSEVIVWNFSGCRRIRARVALACILSLRDGEKLSVHPPIEGREPGEVLLRHPHHSWERGTDENTSIRIALRTARMGSSVQKCWLTPDLLLDR